MMMDCIRRNIQVIVKLSLIAVGLLGIVSLLMMYSSGTGTTMTKGLHPGSRPVEEVIMGYNLMSVFVALFLMILSAVFILVVKRKFAVAVGLSIALVNGLWVWIAVRLEMALEWLFVKDLKLETGWGYYLLGLSALLLIISCFLKLFVKPVHLKEEHEIQ